MDNQLVRIETHNAQGETKIDALQMRSSSEESEHDDDEQVVRDSEESLLFI